MDRKRTGLVIGVLLVLLAVAAVLRWSDEPNEPPEAPEPGRGAREARSDGSERAGSRASPPSSRERRERAIRATPEARRLAAAFHERIRAARNARLAVGGTPVASAGAAGPPPAEPERGSMDPEYIRAAIRELVPLVAECYELARQESPNLEGRLVVSFEIEGEPDVGGVVEDVTVDPEASDSTIQHPTLDECVRETLYTAELPAPEGGGSVTVRYPFVFRDEPEEDEDTEP